MKQKQRTAYSYARFSTVEQASGDSLRRQLEAATLYADENNLILSDISFKDLAVSAFRGNNSVKGALSQFRRAVEDGDIASDSYLLIESPDRLSRLPAVDASAALTAICELGITLVTLDDGQQYTMDRLRGDFMVLIKWLLRAEVAHDESLKKSRRLASAWSNKRSNADTNPITSVCPAWLKLKTDKSGFDLIKNRAAIVKNIFKYSLDGLGQHAIAQKLNDENIKPFGKSDFWHRSYIKKILENIAVIGDFQPHKVDHDDRYPSGKRRIPNGTVIKNYFPSVIDREAFNVLATRRAGNNLKRTRIKYPLANILAGLARCPACSSTMTRINKGKRSKPSLICVKAKVGKCLGPYKTVPLSEIENALTKNPMLWVSDAPVSNNKLEKKWADLEAEIFGTKESIGMIIAEIRGGGGSSSLRDELTKLETILENQETEFCTLSEIRIRETPKFINRRRKRLSEALSAVPLDIGKANDALNENLISVTVDWGFEDNSAPALYINWQQGDTTGVLLPGFPKFQ